MESSLPRRTVLTGFLCVAGAPAFAQGASTILDATTINRIYVEPAAKICSACPPPLVFRPGTPQDVPPSADGFGWIARGGQNFVASPGLFSWIFKVLYHPPLQAEAALLKWAAAQSDNIILYATFAKGATSFGGCLIDWQQYFAVFRHIQQPNSSVPGYLS